MPVQPTFPGVYIEELPSGVRTITGVATSITAFVGRAQRGPVNEPITINSFADFARTFGGLWRKSMMSFAVRDFYQNGGSQAVIVRVFNPIVDKSKIRDSQSAATAVAVAAQGAADSAVSGSLDRDTAKAAIKDAMDGVLPSGKDDEDPKRTALAVRDAIFNVLPDGTEPFTESDKKALEKLANQAVEDSAPDFTRTPLTIGEFTLEAAYEGSWGEKLRGRIDVDVSSEKAKEMGVSVDDLFNLTVQDTGPGGNTEEFRNLTVIDSARRVDKVLEAESSLVRWCGEWPPDPLPTIVTGHDTITTEEMNLEALKEELKELEKEGKDTTKKKEDIKKKKEDIEKEKEKVATSDGSALNRSDFTVNNTRESKTGLFALEDTDIFNLLCIPPHTPDSSIEDALIDEAIEYCNDRRAMFLVDSPAGWKTKKDAIDGIKDAEFTKHKNAAIFFPRLKQPNPLKDNQRENFAPCGAVAGVFARTDVERGVWKAPAGLDATLSGVPELSVPLTDPENGELNPLGVNCLRTKPPFGRIIWGSRTLVGDDRFASEWKYIPVRRTALFIEESLYRGTQWVVFEPNDEPTWAQIRLNLGAFMQNLFRQGAFQGGTPKDAYLVKCDSETTTQNDIDLGIVNILVGFAPLKPAEFVIIKIQQLAGQIEV